MHADSSYSCTTTQWPWARRVSSSRARPCILKVLLDAIREVSDGNIAFRSHFSRTPHTRSLESSLEEVCSAQHGRSERETRRAQLQISRPEGPKFRSQSRTQNPRSQSQHPLALTSVRPLLRRNRAGNARCSRQSRGQPREDHEQYEEPCVRSFNRELATAAHRFVLMLSDTTG